ncbi:hypothetical protein AHiyo4_44740 [Arthrobacter sp. Hiyo4]|nr:hypothetical protein AHiyo4_44740 [Arthrobacter sp. Hiyo4]
MPSALNPPTFAGAAVYGLPSGFGQTTQNALADFATKIDVRLGQVLHAGSPAGGRTC